MKTTVSTDRVLSMPLNIAIGAVLMAIVLIFAFFTPWIVDWIVKRKRR